MEFVDCIGRIDDPALGEYEFRRVGELLIHAVYRMIFVGGLVHCDLHPANVFVSRSGGLIILDTGFTTELSEHDRYLFAHFFRGLVFGEAQTCATILRRTAAYEPHTFNPLKFQDDIEKLMNASSGQTASNFSVVQFTMSLFECQRRHGLVGSPNFVMAIWALLVVEGVLKARWPDLDFQTRAIPYLTGALLGANKSSAFDDSFWV
jgi:ubiquinone biosynthesis protein